MSAILSARDLAARPRAVGSFATRPHGNIESPLLVLGVACAFLFLTLATTLLLVQRASVRAREQLAETALPTEQALGQLQAALASAFERQARVVSTPNMDELGSALDRTKIEFALGTTAAALERRLSTGDNRGTAHPLVEHTAAFLDADQTLLLSVRKRLLLRKTFEANLSAVEGDIGKLIQSANALSGILRLQHIIVLRRLAGQIAIGAPSPELIRAEVVGGVQVRMDDVADLVQGVVGLGRLGGKTGLALTDDALNGLMANEVSQNRSQIEGLLTGLARSAEPGSDVASRLALIADQFHAVSPRISDERREDSLVWLRRRYLEEILKARSTLSGCARSAAILTSDLASLSASSNRQTHAAVQSSARTTRWSRLASLLVSFFGLLACLVAGLRIRGGITSLRETNHELGDLRDNLERKVAERTSQLSASREQYRLLVETTKTIPFELSADLRFRYLGPQALSMFALSKDECLAPEFLDQHLHPDDKQKTFALLAAAFRPAGGHVDIEFRIRRADASYSWLRLIAAVGREVGEPQSDTADADILFRTLSGRRTGRSDAPTERTLRGMLLDVTVTHELEFQLRQAQKLESVGRLASGVAHEINTPVQFVSDNVHFLKDAFRDLASVVVQYRALRSAVADGTATTQMAEELAQAEETADVSYVLESAPSAVDRSIEGLGRIAEIVRSMKDFAHPDQKEMAIIDLNQAISSTLTIARNEYKYVADVETHLGEIPHVMCHAGEINQVFLNIFVNAAHAIGDVVKGTENRGRISVASAREGDDVVVSIRDTGGGIPDSIRERIFDPFFTTKEVGKGTGQGLAIARSVVVDKHGGELKVESQIGVGTTFFIRLPIEGKLAAKGALA